MGNSYGRMAQKKDFNKFTKRPIQEYLDDEQALRFLVFVYTVIYNKI